MPSGIEPAVPRRLSYFALSLVTLGATLLCSCAQRGDAVEAYVHALGAYHAGQLAIAAAGARQALASDNCFLPALMLLGKTSYFMDDEQTAIMAFKKGLSNTPRAGEAALWLARSYRASGKVEEAQSVCDTILTSDPVDIAALRLAAQLAKDKDDVRSAKAYLDRAIDSSSEAGLSFLDRAALLWAVQDRDSALVDIRAALATLPVGSIAHGAASSLLNELLGGIP